MWSLLPALPLPWCLPPSRPHQSWDDASTIPFKPQNHELNISLCKLSTFKFSVIGHKWTNILGLTWYLWTLIRGRFYQSLRQGGRQGTSKEEPGPSRQEERMYFSHHNPFSSCHCPLQIFAFSFHSTPNASFPATFKKNGAQVTIKYLS